MILPKHIDTGRDFYNSVFQNTETETVLRNIVLLQQFASPDAWTPFSWDDYESFCTHQVTYKEKQVIESLVKGGRPVCNTSAIHSAGWLDFDGEHYSFTPALIEALTPYLIS